MPYVQTTWVDNTTPASATNMNHLETMFAEALTSLNADEYAPGVLSGFICSKNATTASQLDVTAGQAYLTQADGHNDLGKVSLTASTQSTAGQLSATLYLDLNPDGSWSFATTHSAVANSLTIATVTTDASGNIATITDTRTTTISQLPSIPNSRLGLPPLGSVHMDAPGWNSYVASIVGGVTTGQPGGIAGDMNGAMLFDGSTGYISVPTSGLPSGAAAFSIECWVKLASNPSGTVLTMSQGTWFTANECVYIQVTNTGAVNFANANAATASASLTVGAWHHLVGTWDGTDLRFYLDGALVGTPQAATMALTTVYAAIGAAPQGGANNFPGDIDEVAWYSTALSGTQVANHYTVGHAGSATTTYAATVLADSPVRYYRLGDTSGRGVMNAVSEHHTLVNQDGGINPTYVAEVAGQATVGSFGVPVIVAQAIDSHIADTSNHTLVSYVVPAQGLYRVSMYITNGNSVSSTINAHCQWTDPRGGTPTVYFSAQSAGTSPILLSGTNTIGGNQGIATYPVVIEAAAAGNTILVAYQNPSGTPNDYVSAIIERLS